MTASSRSESDRLTKLRRVLAEAQLPPAQSAQLDQLRAAARAELQRLGVDRGGRTFTETWAVAAEVLTACLIGLDVNRENTARTLVLFGLIGLDPERQEDGRP